MRYQIILLFLLASFLYACAPDSASDNTIDQVNIRLDRDPQRINPFYAPSSAGREVFQYIFTPLADFHPEDLELQPILITDIPEPQTTEGDSLVAYNIQFKEDAQWSDGTPVTADDYIFTIKAINHPLCQAAAWKPYFAFFKKVEKQDGDEKGCTVYLDRNYMLSKELAVTTSLMPAHIFDPDDILTSLSISDIHNLEDGSDSLHIALFDKLNASMNDKTEVVQTGPYVITEYESEQYIILERKEDYWGRDYPDNPFLQARVSKIIFRIVPDEMTAISMAREGELDILEIASSNTFLDLKEDKDFAQNWTFHTPQLFMYYYIAVNNKNPLLKDAKVRKALAYLTDVEDYIDNVDGGLGVRTIGHFHPARSYYNDKLDPIPYDPGKASELLREAGWTDTNEDGVRDKVIDGQSVPLELELLITGSPLSRSMSLLLQESLGDVGIKMNIISKKSSLMRKENLQDYNYDLAMLAVVQDAAPDDPYARWHSDNAVMGTHNPAGYANPVADSLIEGIRTTTDKQERKQYYRELQKVMYEEQPVIFLYSPLKKILINGRLEALTTPKRPGYMANTFKAVE